MLIPALVLLFAFSDAAQPPQEARPISSYFTTDDYPAAALDAKAQGVVRFRLTIDAQGRVTGCQITQSSGSSVLDATTCRLVARRAHYKPAMGASGETTSGTVDEEVTWRLPSAAPPTR